MNTELTKPDLEQKPQRFTPDGDPRAERRIAADQRLIGDAVRSLVDARHFCALVMIGGYARGEGGIVFQSVQPAPYNDYDYFVVVRGLGRKGIAKLAAEMAPLADELGRQVGVEVDLAILRRETLPSTQASLMFAEMLWGHCIVTGDHDILNAMPAMPFSELPLGEFTRLMLNRGALLLMNQQTLGQGEPKHQDDRDRFIKYIFKATLACGDARLAVANAYHPSYEVKWQRLRKLPGVPEAFLCQYELALRAKFYPQTSRFADTDLSLWQRRTVNFWCDSLVQLESERLGQPLGSWEHYASPTIEKGQGSRTIKGLLGNIAVTLRDYGPRELLANPHWSLHYPRERLISILPSLLVDKRSLNNPTLQRALGISTTEAGRSVTERFFEQWHRYA